MEFFVNPKINFLKWRFHALAFSLTFIAIGAGLLATRGLNLGIDFAGGANVILRFQQAPPISQLRAIVADATIQQYGKAEENSVLIRLPQAKQEGDYAGRVLTMLNQRLNADLQGKLDLNFQGRSALADILLSVDPDRRGSSPDAVAYYQGLAEKIIDRRSELGIFTSMDQVTSVEGVTPSVANLLRERVALGKFNLLNAETVGPQVGKELQQKAFWAIVLSTLAMGAYIAVRFDLKFGVAGVLILVHDSLVTLAFLAMINGQFEIITVAAFLMVIGYSINDTVVVYDRVRENVKKVRMRESFEDVLNHSLNQTLSRTILTGGSVILVLLSLIFFGGQVIKEFALLLLVGTIAGTYSTLFIVPAIVVAWERRTGKKAVASGARRVA
ncbi:MAG TPA: protein translocase subunit SecF [Thermoanaerobaculia bacterium]